eukprot:Gb_19566 [translate_table: standard]
MAIKLDLENGELSEQADISEPLISQEKSGRGMFNRTRSNNGESIAIVIFSTLVVVLGSLEFGFCVGFSSPTQSAMIEDLGLTLSEYSTFGSFLTIGAMIGAVMSGCLADYVGRKGALGISSLSSILGWLAISLSKVTLPLDIGRLLVGYGVGLASYTVPVYIAEITPKNMRGGLVTVNQLSVAVGTLIVYLVGMFVGWRALSLIGTAPCVLLVLGLFFVPESPRWLAKAGRDTEFEAALQALRGKDSDVSGEADEIREYAEELKSLPKARILDLFQQKYAHCIIVGVGLMILQQLGGISALIFYASQIFKAAGFASGHEASVGVAAIQVPLTAIGALLMDKLGRRPLLMVSAGGMSISCFLVGLSFYIQGHATHPYLSKFISILILSGLLAYMATYSLGMGGIPWIIMSEVFPIQMKGIAGSLVTLINWLGSWFITTTFNFLLTWSAMGE